MDSYHPPLDHGHVGISHLRHLSGSPLGLFRAGLGWLLGMGPRRERVADALARRHRLPAFGHDAGEARHAESLEHVAGLRYVLAGDSRNVPHPQRYHQLGPRLRAVVDRQLVRVVPIHHLRRIRLFLFQK